MNLFRSGLTPFAHTVLAYLVAIGLLWGYAATLWWAARRHRSSTQKPAPGSESHQS